MLGDECIDFDDKKNQKRGSALGKLFRSDRRKSSIGSKKDNQKNFKEFFDRFKFLIFHRIARAKTLGVIDILAVIKGILMINKEEMVPKFINEVYDNVFMVKPKFEEIVKVFVDCNDWDTVKLLTEHKRVRKNSLILLSKMNEGLKEASKDKSMMNIEEENSTNLVKIKSGKRCSYCGSCVIF